MVAIRWADEGRRHPEMQCPRCGGWRKVRLRAQTSTDLCRDCLFVEPDWPKKEPPPPPWTGEPLGKCPTCGHPRQRKRTYWMPCHTCFAIELAKARRPA